MNYIENRKGRIFINKVDFYNYLGKGLLNLVFAKFIPMNINDSIYFEGITYYGFCEDFDIIEEGEAIPEYKVEINLTNKTVKFIKNKI